MQGMRGVQQQRRSAQTLVTMRPSAAAATPMKRWITLSLVASSYSNGLVKTQKAVRHCRSGWACIQYDAWMREGTRSG